MAFSRAIIGIARLSPRQYIHTMPRALKNLDVSLGLAMIPVQLFTATSSQGVAFHLLHAKCGTRIQMRLECPIHGIVPREETVRGFEINKDEYVRFEPTLKAPRTEGIGEGNTPEVRAGAGRPCEAAGPAASRLVATRQSCATQRAERGGPGEVAGLRKGGNSTPTFLTQHVERPRAKSRDQTLLPAFADRGVGGRCRIDKEPYSA
jgi:hypothetical protein